MVRISLDSTDIPDLSGIVAEALPAYVDELGAQAVVVLSGPLSSWPVDTGLSKASFEHLVREDGAHLTNQALSATGFPYPVVVEARQGAAESTVRTHIRTIVEAAEPVLQRGLDDG